MRVEVNRNTRLLDSQSEKIFDTWGVNFYTITVMVTSLILNVLYAITFYKAWMGTRYPFIVWLITLFFLSNLGGGLAAIFSH
jgi:hypothetical protein